MKKVLILGVSAVQADAIRILKEMGIETYACSKSDDGPGSKEADHYEVLDFTYIDKVIEIVEKNEIDCVYSVGSDIATRIYSEVSKKMNLPSFISSKTARICNNKNEMRTFFGNKFKGNLNFQVLDNKYEDIFLDFPFIMKPADSQGQRGVNLINDLADFKERFDLSKAYSRSGLVILEEYINGPELSVNVYMIDGKVSLLVASDRVSWKQFQGGLIHKHIVPSTIMNVELEEALADLVARVAKKLKVNNGPLYFQIKVKEKKPFIIEVTPRLDGCHMWNVLHHYTGVNILKLLFEHLLFNNTSEIYKYKKSSDQFILEFMCEYPNSIVDYSKYEIPSDSLYSLKYYEENDIVRAINNRFEKIGYFIVRGSL